MDSANSDSRELCEPARSDSLGSSRSWVTTDISLATFETGRSAKRPHPEDLNPHTETFPPPRKRGRPPLPKPPVAEAKRPVGRPRIHPVKDPSEKRPVGRPRKNPLDSAEGPRRGGVVVRLLDKKLVVPGTSSARNGSDSAPPNRVFPFARQGIPQQPVTHALPDMGQAGSSHVAADAATPTVSELRPDGGNVENLDAENDVDPCADECGLDGIGDGVGGADEHEDDEDDEGDGKEETRKAKRHPLPSWLLSIFTKLCEESYPAKCGSNYVPPLYAKEKSFYFPKTSTYFKLKDGKSDLKPTSLFDPRFFLWDPIALSAIACPNCRRKLSRHSLIKQPRRFITFDESVWMIGYRYQLPRVPYPEWRNERFEAFPSFEDFSDDGPYSYIPSGKWLRDVYDDFIAEHKPAIEKDMSIRDLFVGCLDHTFKITRSSISVLGERIFNALLTLTNYKKEIRMCALVASKSHAAFKEELLKVAASLKLYGHPKVEAMYTDQMSDKAFLEECFPELLDDVVPVEKYSDLDFFDLPDDVTPVVKESAEDINNVMRTILKDLPVELSEPDIFIGFDAEWNVNVSRDGVYTRGGIAVVQIAYKRSVYILQVNHLLQRRRLPSELIAVLSNPRIRKVGRQVRSDLKQLHDGVDNAPQFVGALELGSYAKERNVVHDARAGLSDLCAAVLHKCLRKNVSERIDEGWSNNNLTENQIRYAASDAFVALQIYEELSAVPVPQPLPTVIDPDMDRSVLIYLTNKSSVIARGELPSNDELAVTRAVDGINITPTRIPVKILDVYVPGAVVTTHNHRTLESFGPPPFTLVCLRSHVRTCSITPSVPHSSRSPDAMDIDTSGDQSNANTLTDVDKASDRDVEDDGGPDDLRGSLPSGSSSLPVDTNGRCSLGDMMWDTASLDSDPDEVQTSDAHRVPPVHEHDPESQALGARILEEAGDFDPTKVIRSRVIKDAFHIFHMLRLPALHGARKEFGRTLSDAIFVPDKEDRARITAWGAIQKTPQTFEQIRATRSAWLWKRCRRRIPPPEKLYPLVKRIFETYGSIKDAKSSEPLFNADCWDKTRNILKLIRLGHLSDSPGLPLYTMIGVDSKASNLPIYQCFRGTNAVEGGVHTYLRARLPGSGVSVKHLNSCLADFVLVHNRKVGHFNSTGKPYRSHMDIWVTNAIQEKEWYLEDLGVLFRRPGKTSDLVDWVNGNLYVQTNETIGILTVSPDLRRRTGMAEFNKNTDSKQPHSYLARMQNTHKAVMPVYTNEEKALFDEFMISNSSYNLPGGPNSDAAAAAWNAKADVKENVYYKLADQLRTHYKNWTKLINVKKTLAASAAVRGPLRSEAQDPARSNEMESVPARPLQPHAVNTGYKQNVTVPAAVPEAVVNRPSSEQPGITSVGALPGLDSEAPTTGMATSLPSLNEADSYQPFPMPPLRSIPPSEILRAPPPGPPVFGPSRYTAPAPSPAFYALADTSGAVPSSFQSPAFPSPIAYGYPQYSLPIASTSTPSLPQPQQYSDAPRVTTTYPAHYYPGYFGHPASASYYHTHLHPASSGASTSTPVFTRSFSMPRAIAHANVAEQQSAHTAPEKSGRSGRSCWKCGFVECKGRRIKSLCENPCWECGFYCCEGRSSATPGEHCPTIKKAEQARKDAEDAARAAALRVLEQPQYYYYQS